MTNNSTNDEFWYKDESNILTKLNLKSTENMSVSFFANKKYIVLLLKASKLCTKPKKALIRTHS